jgi:inhibitor of cysteine peptidase
MTFRRYNVWLSKREGSTMNNRVYNLVLVLFSTIILLSGCSSSAALDSKAVSVEISQDNMNSQTDIRKSVEVNIIQSLVVSLPANPSTGFSWTEAKVSDTSVITQSDRKEVAAASGMPGASGTTIWTFKPAKAGQTTITMDYSRPWEGGEKGVKTFTLSVVVK